MFIFFKNILKSSLLSKLKLYENVEMVCKILENCIHLTYVEILGKIIIMKFETKNN